MLILFAERYTIIGWIFQLSPLLLAICLFYLLNRESCSDTCLDNNNNESTCHWASCEVINCQGEDRTDMMSLHDFDPCRVSLLANNDTSNGLLDSLGNSAKPTKGFRRVEFCETPRPQLQGAIWTPRKLSLLSDSLPSLQSESLPSVLSDSMPDVLAESIPDAPFALSPTSATSIDLRNDDFGTEESEFKPATEIFNDTAAWALLEQFGSSKKKLDQSNLTRESLYVRFDPLVKRKSPAANSKSKSSKEARERNKPITLLEADEDLLIMHTPPQARGKFMKASNKRRLNTTVQAELDRMFIHDLQAERMSDGVSPPVLDTDEGIVEVLKYSESDMAKVLMDHQARLMAKERDWEQREHQLMDDLKQESEHVAKMKQSTDDMQKLITEYERTISQVIADKAKLTCSREGDLANTMRERDQAYQQLRTMESAFSDLYGRYEKAKGAIEILKKNEEELKKCIEIHQTRIKKHEQRYDVLKKHAQDKLQSANEEIDKVHKGKNAEVARLQAAQKRTEMQLKSLQSSLDQKIKENAELTSICDDLIKQVGGE